MVNLEVNPVGIKATINTPFRVVALFVTIVLAAIIIINAG